MSIQPGLHQHFKGGLYKVLGTVKHSETLEELVLYESQKDGGLWVRPLQMFTETVEHEGRKVPRFQLISE